MRIPPGNLKRFAIDSFHDEFFALSTDALHRIREDVEILQLGYSKYSLDFAELLLFISSQGASQGHRTVDFPKLRTIFFTMEPYDPSQFPTPKMLTFLTGNMHQIKCMAISWPEKEDLVPEFRELLKHARNLTDLYLIASTNWLYDEFEELLETLPMLTHITISSSSRAKHPFEELESGIVHSKLETITIVSEASINLSNVFSWGLILDKIRQNELPALKAIYIKAPHLSGCLDSPWILPNEYQDKWRTAIKLCRQKGIQLLSLQGHTIYLWEERHGIKFKQVVQRPGSEQDARVYSDSEDHREESGGDECLTDTSDDSQWYRLETQSDPPSTDSDSGIDDDSDDGHYRYVAQPDVELYNAESDGSEDEWYKRDLYVTSSSLRVIYAEDMDLLYRAPLVGTELRFLDPTFSSLMEVAHGSPSTSETPSCPSCGRWEQSFYEKQIRRLRERLEYSQ
ncbi:6425_t:CDS:2, partial [Acaulospora colombiana]